MFYMSGSSKVAEKMPADTPKFDNIFHNFNQHNDLTPFHINKFENTASVFYIPQQTFGERIKPGSFQLRARTGSYTDTTNEIIIKDDKFGNLYSSNSTNSQSSATSLSSSDNYIGNIFYDLGVAVLTETASWSGSVHYSDIGRSDGVGSKEYQFWDLKFNSSTPIFTSQWSVKVNSGEFNHTMNASTKLYHGGDYLPSGSSLADTANIRKELTGSGWSPYFNQIALYRNQPEEPVIIANLPRAVKVRDDIDLIVTFRLDH